MPMTDTEILVPFLQTGEQPAAFVYEHALWGTPSELVPSRFGIAYDNRGLWLKFNVYDTIIQSQKRVFNDDVHLDNCVEFFIRFQGDDNYYNFEFNCLGSIKAAYGPDRHQRTFLPTDLLRQVGENLQVSISNQNDEGLINWIISAHIDLSVFFFSNLTSLKDTTCQANFTKCGDNLPQPNFLSWAYIDTVEPDYHQPEFFKQLRFA